MVQTMKRSMMMMAVLILFGLTATGYASAGHGDSAQKKVSNR